MAESASNPSSGGQIGRNQAGIPSQTGHLDPGLFNPRAGEEVTIRPTNSGSRYTERDGRRVPRGSVTGSETGDTEGHSRGAVLAP